MGEETDEIEQHIREQRRELGQNMNELQRKVKDTVNWRVQFEQHPMAMLGIALGGGFLLSGLLGSRRQFNSGSRATAGSTWEAKAPVLGPTSKMQSEFYDFAAQSWQEITEALLAVAATKLGSLVDSVVPGFNDEYTKVRRTDGSYSANRF